MNVHLSQFHSMKYLKTALIFRIAQVKQTEVFVCPR